MMTTVEEIEFRLFELQELIHANTENTLLEDKLHEIDDIVDDKTPIELVNEIEQLRFDLNDKNWLIIYQSTSNQCKFMLNSLDKSYNYTKDLLNDQSDFKNIYNSFKIKLNYYTPSIQRVLNTLTKYICQHSNGHCLRDHADLQRRWKELDNQLLDLDFKLQRMQDVNSLSNNLQLLNIDSTPSKSPSSRPSSSLSFTSKLPRPSTPSSRSYSPTPSNPSTPSRIPRTKRSSSHLFADIGSRNLMTPEPQLRATARPFWGASNEPIPRSRRIVSGRSSNISTSTINDLATYHPNSKDPLDIQVAKIYNENGLGIGIERIDPPLAKKPAPDASSNIQAQYAFETTHNRKVVVCKLLELKATRKAQLNGEPNRQKVMVRVGGGWKDLKSYLIERQQ